MKRWSTLLLLLFSPLLLAEEMPGLHQVCLDNNSDFCAYEANPDAAQAVVLVHGLNGSALHDWQDQLQLLAKNYHVLAIELPGFDKVGEDPSHYSMPYFSEVIHRFTSRYIGHPYFLIGHSMGGAIALRHALYYPDEVTRLVLVDVAGVLHRISYSRELVGHWVRGGTGEHSGLAGFLEKMTMKLLGSTEDLDGEGMSANDALLDSTSDPHALAAMQLVRQNFSGQLIGMWVPTLIIWGADDPIAPLRTAYSLDARLPNSRLKILPDAKHMPMLEQTEAFNKILLQFLQADGVLPDEDDGFEIPTEDGKSERVAICHDKRDMVYEGDYERIELRGCERVLIRKARVRELEVHNSRVSILLSRIGSESSFPALEARGADIKITASRLIGDPVLRLSGSRLDIAGSTLVAGSTSVQVESGSELVFSVSELREPDGVREFLHGLFRLDHQEALSLNRQQ